MNTTILNVQHLVKHFDHTRAVDDVSFSIQRGEVFGFLGPNGAGKTTTIRCMMDFLRPQSGHIQILGFDAQKESVEVKRHIGHASEEAQLYANWTGHEHVTFIRKLRRSQNDIAEALISRLDVPMNMRAKELSQGNRQKLGLLLALMSQPELLILDEPTSALDPLLKNTTYELIEDAIQNGQTAFFSSHNLPEVERICDRVGIIRNGKMIAVESVANMKSKKVSTVRVAFEQPSALKDLLHRLQDIQVIHRNSESATFEIHGDINPLLEHLHKHRVRDLQIERASLEQIFLGYYRTSDSEQPRNPSSDHP